LREEVPQEEEKNKRVEKGKNIMTTIYTNGDIITMLNENREVEALTVRDGKILAVGSLADVEKAAGLGAEKVDLGSKTLMPAFFDPHGHLFLTTLLVAYADLNAPPVGKVDSIASLQQTLHDYANEKNLKADDWIIGMNYDDTGLKEQRHPTRYDLDEVSTANPIFIMHSSSHFGVANSKALELAGITSQTEDPRGGAFLRD
jgi:predicted amidohydrolase YtcJ